MNLAKNKYISLVLLTIISGVASADFKQGSVRYFSYYDIINHFKEKVYLYSSECISKSKENGLIFGYSSPTSGKPLSQEPNFDFLSLYLNCLNETQIEAAIAQLIPYQIIIELGDRERPYEELSEELIDKVIDSLLLALIGPESVIISYGHISSQEELKNIIKNSALEIVKNKNIANININEFIKEIIILIHLRDEFLSY